jgi:hypothetical protein
MHREEKLIIKGYGDQPGSALASVEAFPQGQRFTRAVQGLGKWWVVALLCVFIPVAHFVLVPGFVLVGGVIFFQRLSRREEVVKVTGACPDCQAEQVFEVGPRWRPPFSCSCRDCGRGLDLTV